MNWIDNHAVASRDEPIGVPIGDFKPDLMISEVSLKQEPSTSHPVGWVGARLELFHLRQLFWRNIVRQITSRVSFLFN